MGALEVPRNKIKGISVSWNDSFRHVFGFRRWESVKELQGYLGEQPFELMYDLYCWKFLTD